MDQDHIDGLLERYLHLLHDYTSLREELAALQTAMYQNVARANFAAERGLRYGQDYYDERMQASRRLAISQNGARVEQQPNESQDRQSPVISQGGAASFTIVNPATACSPASVSEDSEAFGGGIPNPHPDSPHPKAEAEVRPIEQSATDTECHSAQTSPPIVDVDAQPRNSTESPASFTAPPKEEKIATSKKSDDPLRWFGLLAPMPLRQAQAQSVRAVEHVIPRLVSLDAEMAVVEIEVRRARKRRAKAEAAASKSSQQSG